MAIGRRQQGAAVVGGEARVAQAGIDGGQQAPHHRHQVGGELELDRLAGGLRGELLDLTGVAMPHHAVGGNRLGGLRQQQVFLGGPPTTGAAGLGVDHDPGEFDQALLQEGEQGQQAGGGETARCRHKPRLADARLLPLHQAVDGLLAKLPIAAGHLPGLTGIHLLPAGQGAVAVVGREIHHLHPPAEQVGDKGGGETVGEAEHRQIRRRGDRLGIGAAHHRIVGQGQEGHQLAPALAAAALAPQEGHR